MMLNLLLSLFIEHLSLRIVQPQAMQQPYNVKCVRTATSGIGYPLIAFTKLNNDRKYHEQITYRSCAYCCSGWLLIRWKFRSSTTTI
ncbi:hypothetical protein VCR5J5_1430017 [Vibrio crassostreae]|uniref:Uncharacterized protein n=1 Tax=Vibrio crassostreae TaxID=246167 RepID=A0A822MU99_9VIBR|nr:hypothetical protein VCR5J5_1430017 [Vibrio crassostreae]